MMSKESKKNTKYQNAIEALGMTQIEAANFFRIGERTSRRYAAAKTLPVPLEIALALMIKFNVTPEQAIEMIKPPRKQKKPQSEMTGAK